jgi:hypothetical protein
MGKTAGKLKRSLKLARDGADRQRAALALLQHSIRFGHGRLLLRRFEAAIHCGAELSAEDIDLCLQRLLSRNDDRITQALAQLSRSWGL